MKLSTQLAKDKLKPKKHLSYTALKNALSQHLETIKDHRGDNCTYSQHDTMMSAFACMLFQDPSLAAFQRRLQDEKNINNLKTLFNVSAIPKDSQFRVVVDGFDSEYFRPLFKDYFERLRRHKHLEDFQILPGIYQCSIDGTQYHSSGHIKCDKCLIKNHRNGSTTYSHSVLQGAFMHPAQKQVIPVMPEAIANTDGSSKQDCEYNAATRFIKQLKIDHPQLGILIVGDGLFSKTPMVNLVTGEGMHYLFVAKPDDHKYMMAWLSAFDTLPQKIIEDERGRLHRYTWKNEIPLNDGGGKAPLVNYIKYELINEDGKVTYKNSWVTDISVEADNVETLVKAGRCRWKIENECFNTLKNQGYELNHNFGHGSKNLSFNMYLVTLLAFFCASNIRVN